MRLDKLLLQFINVGSEAFKVFDYARAVSHINEVGEPRTNINSVQYNSELDLTLQVGNEAGAFFKSQVARAFILAFRVIKLAAFPDEAVPELRRLVSFSVLEGFGYRPPNVLGLSRQKRLKVRE